MNENPKEEKDLLQIILERIEAESRFKDIEKTCTNAGLSRTTYEKAITKARSGKKYDDLTDGEEKVLLAHISILDDRAEERKKKLKCYANLLRK